MTVMQWIRALFGRQHEHTRPASPPEQPVTDTLGAIDALTKAIKSNPGAVEICSALGNIYRMRGELDKAIRTRSSLISRPDLGNEDKGRVFFELGRDYARAGILDQAEKAFLTARTLLGSNSALDLEIAELTAKGRDFLEASRQYHYIGCMPQAAHYRVRAACEHTDIRLDLLREAMDLYPASPEAWLELIGHLFRSHSWDTLLDQIERGLRAILPGLDFLILSPLLDDAAAKKSPLPSSQLDSLEDIVRRHPQSLLLAHNTGSLFRMYGRLEEARTWQEKALLLNTSFWPARLELLTLAMSEQTLTPGFALQLRFLLEHARQVKRYECSRCGLRRGEIFFRCPKCQSWHSISYRNVLHD